MVLSKLKLIGTTLKNKAKKLLNRQHSVQQPEEKPQSDNNWFRYIKFYNTNENCKVYIDCTNARKLKSIILNYLSNESESEILELLEYKIEVLIDKQNGIKSIIKDINNKGNITIDNFASRRKYNISNICIKTDKEYKLCQKYLEYEPVFFYNGSKKLYTASYTNKDLINKPIDNNICKVLITCKNALLLADEIENIIDQNNKYTSKTLKNIEIKVYFKYLPIKLTANIASINNSDLSFTIKYDEKSNINKLLSKIKSKIYTNLSFKFFSLCITDDKYNKYDGCGDMNSENIKYNKDIKYNKTLDEFKKSRFVELNKIKEDKKEQKKNEQKKNKQKKNEQQISEDNRLKLLEKKELGEKLRKESRNKEVYCTPDMLEDYLKNIKPDQNIYTMNGSISNSKYNLNNNEIICSKIPNYNNIVDMYFISCKDAEILIACINNKIANKNNMGDDNINININIYYIKYMFDIRIITNEPHCYKINNNSININNNNIKLSLIDNINLELQNIYIYDYLNDCNNYITQEQKQREQYEKKQREEKEQREKKEQSEKEQEEKEQKEEQEKAENGIKSDKIHMIGYPNSNLSVEKLDTEFIYMIRNNKNISFISCEFVKNILQGNQIDIYLHDYLVNDNSFKHIKSTKYKFIYMDNDSFLITLSNNKTINLLELFIYEECNLEE